MVSGERFELGKDWKISEGQATNKVNKVVVVVVVAKPCQTHFCTKLL